MTGDLLLAYFITWTCYGTWLHGRAPGSVDDRHNRFGDPVLPPDPAWETEMRRQLAESPFSLDQARRRVVLRTIQEVSNHRRWRLLAAHIRSAHLHIRCTRSRLTHKPDAQAKGRPSLARQACVSIPNASSIVTHAECHPDKVMEYCKAYCTRRLREAGFEPTRRHRWTEGGSKRYLWNPEQMHAAIKYVVEEQGEPMEIFRGSDAVLKEFGL